MNNGSLVLFLEDSRPFNAVAPAAVGDADVVVNNRTAMVRATLDEDQDPRWDLMLNSVPVLF